MTKKGSPKRAHVYRNYEDTDRFLIEVALDNYEDMFNEWDPAPFKRRDIDPDLRTFLDDCSREISLKHPLAIAFFLPKGEIDPEKQQKCIEGLHTFFIFNRHLTERVIRYSRRTALRYLLIGLLFLLIAVGFDKQFEKTVLSGVLGQGLFIGGWLFVWEALSIIVFKGGTLNLRLKKWDRFLDAPITFKKERRPEQVFE